MVRKMKRHEKAGKKVLIVSILLLAVSVLLHVWDFSTNIGVDEAGFAYAVSPDKRWKAEMCSGYCKDNEKDYAVIYLWDMEEYPSMLKGTCSTWGKKPEVKLVFPKSLYIRDGKCDVKWISSSVFEIEYANTVSDEKILELLTYDVCTHEFGLRRKKEDSE